MNIRERKTRQEKKANYALQHVRTDSSYMVDQESLEFFMTHVLILQKPVQWFAEHINGLVSIRNLRHKRVNTLLLACIH